MGQVLERFHQHNHTASMENSYGVRAEAKNLEGDKVVMMKLLDVQLDFIAELAKQPNADQLALVTEYAAALPTLLDGNFVMATDEHEQAFRILEELIANVATIDFATADAKADCRRFITEALRQMQSSYKTEQRTKLQIGKLTIEPHYARHLKRDIEHFQLLPSEHYLEVHLDYAPTEESRIGSPASDFRKMVPFVKAANINAIVGGSWLMDLPMAQQLGFEITGTAQQPFEELGYWAQLLDAKGNIKPRVKDYLFEHKRLPYDFKYGKMSLQTFLEKYDTTKTPHVGHAAV